MSLAVTASEARKNLFPLIEQVNEDRTPIEITSRRGDAVLDVPRRLRRARGDSLDLLRVPANARHLLESLPAGTVPGSGRAARPGAMRLVFTPNGWADYTYWLAADRQMLNGSTRSSMTRFATRWRASVEPEPLRHMLAGVWSRRITGGRELVAVDGDNLVVLQARFHYD